MRDTGPPAEEGDWKCACPKMLHELLKRVKFMQPGRNYHRCYPFSQVVWLKMLPNSVVICFTLILATLSHALAFRRN